ncbi:MAG: FAD:protein FMN transferase [Bacteroidales bacterium]|nr:FAD:protein FMN transferase [Bacteroidales bacterium]
MKKIIYIVVAIGLVALAMCRTKEAETQVLSYHKLEGTVFHTIYHITYQGERDYHDEIKQLFKEFDGSLSMFNDTSIITRMNNCDTSVVANHYFRHVFTKAMEVSEATGGAFDITVAPLVNLWGFGFKNSENVSQAAIDSILQFVGYKTVHLDEEGHLHKDDPRTIMDASSIAKGYMSDVVADFLREQGVENYMVEIGGEVALNGVNPKGSRWSIGINKPTDDSTQVNSELQDILYMSEGGVATSGNYRNFYYKDGKKYAHTIDPHTGYPIQQDILSSTVIARDCMTADAYATAFMVLGKEKAMEVLAKDTTLMAYFIVDAPDADDGNGGYEIVYSPALEQRLKR